MEKSSLAHPLDSVCVLKCDVVHLNVCAETHYTERVWVDDTSAENGFGFYKEVKKKYRTPRVRVDFKANVRASFKDNVDCDLIVGATYFDGLNNFIALSKNEIRNVNDCVEAFRIPKEVRCIGSAHY